MNCSHVVVMHFYVILPSLSLIPPHPIATCIQSFIYSSMQLFSSTFISWCERSSVGSSLSFVMLRMKVSQLFICSSIHIYINSFVHPFISFIHSIIHFIPSFVHFIHSSTVICEPTIMESSFKDVAKYLIEGVDVFTQIQTKVCRHHEKLSHWTMHEWNE